LKVRMRFEESHLLRSIVVDIQQQRSPLRQLQQHTSVGDDRRVEAANLSTAPTSKETAMQ
jgi:hypothetical protein